MVCALERSVPEKGYHYLTYTPKWVSFSTSHHFCLICCITNHTTTNAYTSLDLALNSASGNWTGLSWAVPLDWAQPSMYSQILGWPGLVV